MKLVDKMNKLNVIEVKEITVSELEQKVIKMGFKDFVKITTKSGRSVITLKNKEVLANPELRDMIPLGLVKVEANKDALSLTFNTKA